MKNVTVIEFGIKKNLYYVRPRSSSAIVPASVPVSLIVATIEKW